MVECHVMSRQTHPQFDNFVRVSTYIHTHTHKMSEQPTDFFCYGVNLFVYFFLCFLVRYTFRPTNIVAPVKRTFNSTAGRAIAATE